MSKVIIVTGENFEKDVLKSELPVLVDFWATWCGPCMMMAPVLDELAEVFAGKIVIGKADVDEATNQELAAKYRIQSIPNLKLFKNGVVIKDYVGFRDAKSFTEELSSAI